ncbi:hypothetical protein BDV97DRAFT_398217 [Delphinella strobiligena]|nr:hypothetical protein BDV97DRAFT_398217 [Delphinella strobiligena]
MIEDDDFDSSPRPAKKRRVITGAAKNAKKPATTHRVFKPKKGDVNDVGGTIVSDDDDVPVAKPKRGRPKKVIHDSDNDGSIVSAASKKSTKGRRKSRQVVNDSEEDVFDAPAVPAKKSRARKKKQPTPVLDSDEDGSVVSAHSAKGKKTKTTFDDFDDDGFAKPQKPKYAIHQPAQDNLKDVYLDPNAPPPSTNPWEIRGAIWKKNLPASKSVFDAPPARPAPAAFTRPQAGPVGMAAKVDNVRPSLAKFMAPSSIAKQDDIPNSDDLDADDLDAEDWAQSGHEDARPSARQPSVAPKAPTWKPPSPRLQSPRRQDGPAARPAPPVRSPPDTNYVEDSILMSDDLDPEDWAALETGDAEVPAAREPRIIATARANFQTVLAPLDKAQKTIMKTSKPIPKPTRQRQQPPPGPFIEIEDDISEEDIFVHTSSPKPQLSETNISKPATKPSCPALVALQTANNISDEEFCVDDFNSPEYQRPQTFGARSTAQFSAPVASGAALPRQTSISAVSIADELADLPSDAFDSDSGPSPTKTSNQVVHVSSQHIPGQVRNRVAPQNGLVQTTLFGGKARPEDATAMANKKHAWPLATQVEGVTHHKLDQEAIKTWVYPTNLGTTRDYQYNIVARGLFHNLLVALPTGLGKTFIAATVMLNWFRWAPESKIVFVAPTKPLVTQQIDACFKIVGIPRSETVLLTGDTKPAIRAEEWKEKRVFFMTPQTIINDLKHGYCDPKRIVLMVVDEAHRATGGYAYVEVIKFLRRFNQSFRVLALTATPGATVEAVQNVIDGLDISRVEIRTETSIDIRQYVHTRDIDTMKFDYSEEQNMIMELLSKALQPVLTKLNGQNAYWLKDPMKLTAYGCTLAQKKWGQSDAGRKAPPAIKGMVASIFTILASLAHGISLLKFHGVGPFYRSMTRFRNDVDGGLTKGKYALQVRQDENFIKMMGTVQNWTRNPDFLGHPKLEYLRGVILNHFLDAGENTRIMVFAHWRDSAEEIVRVLKRNEPMIRPHVFVGQAASKESEGMNQKTQLDVINKFKEGKYNTLVATSIGEEGLDIGEVDLIVCYDASSSPIRMLQRMGRTGRKRKGNIVLLLMRDKEEDDFEKAKDNYEKMQAMISEGTRFTFHDDKSPRIIPRGINPAVDKRVVEIPIENSQADLPEPNRRKRVPKKPPKKFHMPDNVRTGFVKAGRIDDSDEGDGTARPQAKTKTKKATATAKAKSRTPTPEPESVPLPFLGDVLLNKVQERELERKYQYVSDAHDGVPTVAAPRLDVFPRTFPGPARMIKHGDRTLAVAGMMQRMHNMNSDKIQDFKDGLRLSDLSMNADHLVGEADQRPHVDTDLPELVTLVKKGGRKKAASKPKAVKTPKAKVAAKTRGRGAYARHDSSDMEGDESEPEPTPANMRIGTQGIDLGSDDTMGSEEDDGEPDSELAEFVVGSSAPIETVSSSLPRMHDDESDEELVVLGGTAVRVSTDDENETEDERHVSSIRTRLKGKKRLIDDSDHD